MDDGYRERMATKDLRPVSGQQPCTRPLCRRLRAKPDGVFAGAVQPRA
jgi:hypothetical protein